MDQDSLKETSVQVQTSKTIHLRDLGRNTKNLLHAIICYVCNISYNFWFTHINCVKQIKFIENGKRCEELTPLPRRSLWIQSRAELSKENLQKCLQHFMVLMKTLSGLSLCKKLAILIDKNMTRLWHAAYGKTGMIIHSFNLKDHNAVLDQLQGLHYLQNLMNAVHKRKFNILSKHADTTFTLMHFIDLIRTVETMKQAMCNVTVIQRDGHDIFAAFLKMLECPKDLHAIDTLTDTDQFPCTGKDNKMSQKKGTASSLETFLEFSIDRKTLGPLESEKKKNQADVFSSHRVLDLENNTLQDELQCSRNKKVFLRSRELRANITEKKNIERELLEETLGESFRKCSHTAGYASCLEVKNEPNILCNIPLQIKLTDIGQEHRRQKGEYKTQEMAETSESPLKEITPHCPENRIGVDNVALIFRNNNRWDSPRSDKEFKKLDNDTFQQERTNKGAENCIKENTSFCEEKNTYLSPKRSKEPHPTDNFGKTRSNEELSKLEQIIFKQERNRSKEESSVEGNKTPIIPKELSISNDKDGQKSLAAIPCPKDFHTYSIPEDVTGYNGSSQTGHIAEREKNVTEMSTADDNSSPNPLFILLYNPTANFDLLDGQLKSSYVEIESYTLMYLGKLMDNKAQEMAVFTLKSRQSFMIFHSGVQLIEKYICSGDPHFFENFSLDDCKFTLIRVSRILLELYVITVALESFDHAQATAELENKGKHSVDVLIQEVKHLKNNPQSLKSISFEMVRGVLMELAYAMPPRGEKIMKHCLFEAMMSNGIRHVSQESAKVLDREPKVSSNQHFKEEKKTHSQESYDEVPNQENQEKSRESTSQGKDQHFHTPTLTLESGHSQEQVDEPDSSFSTLSSSSLQEQNETKAVQESVPETQQPDTDNHETVTYNSILGTANQPSSDEFLKEILDQTQADVSTVHKSISARYDVTPSEPLLDRYMRESNKNFQELCQNLTLLCGESFTAWEAQGDSFPLSECKEILLEVGKECLQVCFDSLAKQFFHRLTPDRVTDVEASVARISQSLVRHPFQIEPSTTGQASTDSITMAQLGESLRTRAQESQGEDVFAGTEITGENVQRISPEDQENNLTVTLEKK